MTVTADDSKWKESVKDSTDAEIADNCMEEKNDDDSQFPEHSESHIHAVKRERKSARKGKIMILWVILWVKQNK